MTDYEIIPEYTDERLGDTCKGDVLKILRTVPADWRQSVMAATHKDCYRTETRWANSRSGRMAESLAVPTGADWVERLRVRADEAIAGTLTPRMEKPATPAHPAA